MIETEDVKLSQERLAALKELLNPVKDLAKNWNVNITLELEKFMSDLDHDSDYNNFVEAALVIQGSAGVWEKKVEYLYRMVINSLDMIEEKKAKSGNDSSNDNGVEVQDEEDEMTLGPVSIKIANNTDLKFSDIEATWFKPRLPLFLTSVIKKTCKNEIPLLNKKGIIIGNKDDFLINTCLIHKSGFASVDIDGIYQLAKSAKKTFTPFYKRCVSPFGTENIRQKEDCPNLAAAISINDLHENSVNPLDLSDGEDNAPDIPEVENDSQEKKEGTDFGIKRNDGPDFGYKRSDGTDLSSKRSDNHQPTSCKNHRLDPYAVTTDRPFAKTQIKKPCLPRKRKRHTPTDGTITNFVKSNSSKKASRDIKIGSILRKPVFSENLNLYLKLDSKEKSSNITLSSKMTSQNVNIPPDLLSEVHIPVVNSDDDDENEDLPVQDDNLNTPVSLAIEASENLNKTDLEGAPNPELYEELVRRHVENFTADAQTNFKVSKLRERVLEWESKIMPILEEEEKQKPYDICSYSKEFISNLWNCQNHKGTFKNIVTDHSRREVCRYFLTSLMLTNSGNIDHSTVDNECQYQLLSDILVSDTLQKFCISSEPVTN